MSVESWLRAALVVPNCQVQFDVDSVGTTGRFFPGSAEKTVVNEIQSGNTYSVYSPFHHPKLQVGQRENTLHAVKRLVSGIADSCVLLLPFGIVVLDASKTRLHVVYHLIGLGVSAVEWNKKSCVLSAYCDRVASRYPSLQISVALCSTDLAHCMERYVDERKRASGLDMLKNVSRVTAAFPLCVADSFLDSGACESMLRFVVKHQDRLFSSSISLSGSSGSKAVEVERTSSSWTIPRGWYASSASGVPGEIQDTDSSAFVEAVRHLVHRIEAYTGCTESWMEDLQIVRYRCGQQYVSHVDFMVPGRKVDNTFLERGGQRRMTMLLYLNSPPNLQDDQYGGATRFDSLGVQVVPRQGRVACWPNCVLCDVSGDQPLRLLSRELQQTAYSNHYVSVSDVEKGRSLTALQEDWRTWHSGRPILHTDWQKFAVNIWIRERSISV
eukprot:ANDGO_00129.mRNA.1 hypothetical protein AURANDRAFT_39521